MIYALAYIAALVLFTAIDITWLMTMGGHLYKQTLGDILLPSVNIAPAIAFYLMYPAALVYFAVMPSLKSGSVSLALLNGALLGFFAYGTYELTNFATLRNWTLQITVVDIAYGAITSGLVAAGVVAILLALRG